MVIVFACVQYKPATLFSGRYIFPTWSAAIGALVILILIGNIPICAIVCVVRSGMCKKGLGIRGAWKVGDILYWRR